MKTFSALLFTLATIASISVHAQSDPIVPLPVIAGTTTGTIAAKFDVDGTGIATYNIPIAAPPGTNGLVPKLALDYRSNERSGPIGPGWRISGLSAIARCPTNYARDGYVRLVQFDGNDRLCIDGVRIKEVTGVYGAAGTVYRTDPDSQIKIISNGQSGSGPLSFTVFMKNGLIYEYGSTADSRLEAQGTPHILFWQLSRIADRSGNYLNVVYSKDATLGEILPLQINYTGNARLNLAPYNSLRFTYEPRTVSATRWVNGALISSTKRLKSLATYTDQAVAWTYNFTYVHENVAREDHLSRLQECPASGGCLSTTFAWGPEYTNSYDFTEPALLPGIGNNYNSISGSGQPVLVGDWNGDGKSDIARILVGHIVFYVRGNGNFTQYADVNLWNRYASTDASPVLVGDWNGDGKSDLAIVQPDSSIHVYMSHPQGGFSFNFTQLNAIATRPEAQFVRNFIFRNNTTTPVAAGDWNADGRTDFLIKNDTFVGFFLSNGDGTFVRANDTRLQFNKASTYGPTYESPLIVGDWNGDGLSDFALASYSMFEFYASNGQSATLLHATLNYAPQQGYNSTSVYPVLVGDWNGDGLTDFGRVAGNSTILCDSTGKGLANCRSIADFAPAYGYTDSDTYPIFVGDWNGDGVSDIARLYNSGTRFYNIKGNSFFGPHDRPVLQTTSGVRSNAYYPIVLGDWSGDGFTDIARVDEAGIIYQKHATSFTNLLTTITDNIGAVIKIEYAALSSLSPQIYTQTTGAAYPILDVSGSSQQVAAVSKSNGLGTFARVTYNYAGLRYDQLAKSIIGFSWVRALDQTRGITTTTYYETEGEYRGAVNKVEQQLSNGTVISRSTNTWARRALAQGGSFDYISRTVENAYELDGSLITSTASDFFYDDFANPTQTDIRRSDNSSETTTNTYINDTSNWLIGQLEKSQVTNIGGEDGSVALTRNAAFTYAAGTGLLLNEKTEPGHVTLETSKSYNYDGFGNVIATSLSAPNVEPRNVSSIYDARGQFPTKTTNALGQSEYPLFEPKYGRFGRLQDKNNLVWRYWYDNFGRTYVTQPPDGTMTRMLYFKAVNPELSNCAYFIRTDKTGQGPHIDYYDVLGREIRSESTGFGGQRIFVDKVYDDKGSLILVSEPYFSTESPLWNSYEYDALGRLTKTTAPGNRTTIFSYYGLTTITTNSLGQKTIKTVNARGQTLVSQDAAGKNVIYRYDSAGNLTQIVDPANNSISMQYDPRGNRIRLEDPDVGVVTSSYNALGEVLYETNANNVTIYKTYDKLGRLIKKDTPEGSRQWIYDATPNGVGSVAQVRGINGFTETFLYDTLGRLRQDDRVIRGQIYSVKYTYDQYSRPKTLSYPSGLVTTNVYNANGFLNNVNRASDSFMLWRADSINARGQLTLQTYGNGLQTTKVYNPNNALVQEIRTGSIQNLNFTFDSIGNLTQRRDLNAALTENFSYDNRNRLIQSQVVGQLPITTVYDDLGNITSRSDVGTYRYGERGAGPHAVTTIIGVKPNSYTYDLAGFRRASNGGSIAYNSTGAPIDIRQGTYQMALALDPNDRRVEEVIYNSGLQVQSKVMIGAIYEKINKGGAIRELHYIMGSEGAVAVYTTKPGPTTSISYLHTDHLGSIQTITADNAAASEVSSFDSWGLRRSPSTWTALTGLKSAVTDRGFTGHEELPDFSLIHMNGRVYDPVVGRFVSADPFIQSPSNLQSLNRYSYVNNNPLSFVDPSGYFLKGFFRAIGAILKKVVPIALTVAAAYFTAGSLNAFFFPMVQCGMINATLAATLSGVGAGMASSVVGALANGGSFSDGIKAGIRGAPMSALRAVVAFGIGEGFESRPDFRPGVLTKIFGSYSSEAKIIAHGLGSGALGAIEGKNFMQGFFAGAAGEAGVKIGGKYLPGDLQIVSAAITGGTAAAITGGKFADGAISASFIYLYNSTIHQETINTLNKIDPKGDSYHFFPVDAPYIRTRIPGDPNSMTDWMRAFNALRIGAAPTGAFSAPWAVTDRVVHIPMGGEIIQVLDEANFTIYNITRPGHIFYPGITVRSIVSDGTHLYVQTYGEGNGNFGAINNLVGPYLFKDLDNGMAKYLAPK